MNLAVITQLAMLATKNFIDIPIQNDDVDVEIFNQDEDIRDDEDNVNNDPPKNEASLFGGEHEVLSPLFRELNWDVISVISVETLTSCTGLWNESNNFYQGLQFETKANLQYVVKHYSIHRNQYLVVFENDLNFWVVKCKKSSEGRK